MLKKSPHLINIFPKKNNKGNIWDLLKFFIDVFNSKVSLFLTWLCLNNYIRTCCTRRSAFLAWLWIYLRMGRTLGRTFSLDCLLNVCAKDIHRLSATLARRFIHQYGKHIIKHLQPDRHGFAKYRENLPKQIQCAYEWIVLRKNDSFVNYAVWSRFEQSSLTCNVRISGMIVIILDQILKR